MNWPNAGDEEGDNAAAEENGVYEPEGQLSLSDDDDALPWLESDDDYEEEGSDYRILIFAAVALLALVGILFGVNYMLGDRPAQGDVIADGSTIEAPDEPYKMRPEDPGGTEVAGTGDVSFQVGEGQGSEGQLADSTPAPSIDLAQEDAAEETPAPAAASGVGVQVGAFSTRQSAENGWNVLRNRFSVLQGVNHRIVEGRADSGVIYRLQAVAGSVEAADSLCRSIRNSGGDCQVKH